MTAPILLCAREKVKDRLTILVLASRAILAAGAPAAVGNQRLVVRCSDSRKAPTQR